MKIVLAFNQIDQISGEKAFFENMVGRMGGLGHDISICQVPCYPMASIPGRIEQYSRFPMLMNARSMLKRLEGADVVHFLNSALAPAGRGLRFGMKIGTSHFFAESCHELAPPSNAAVRAAERLYCGYLSYLDRPALDSLDLLAASGPYEAGCLISRYGLDESKVRFIAPGVDADSFKKAQKTDLRERFGCEETALFLGRLNERAKGVSYLIRAMKLIRRPGLKLLIAGEGPDRKNYERQVEREGLQDKVIFLGRLDDGRKSAIQKSADIVVMPSLYEVFGMVFAESLACGVPVVAFDMPFWKGLYDGAGVFAKPRDSASLAGCMSMALDDGALRKKIRMRGMELASKYDIGKVVEEYVRIYEHRR